MQIFEERNRPDMNNDTAEGHLKAISDVVVEELKGLAASGEQLTAENLTSKLSTRSELKALVGVAAKAEAAETSLTTDNQKVVKIKKQLEQSQIQRDRLLKQISELEESESGTSGFYQQTLLMFVELLRTEENKSIHAPLDAMKQALKNGESIGNLEGFTRQIKDITLKEQSPKGQKPSGGVLDRLLSRSSKGVMSDQDALDQLRNAYTEIIDELKLNLDNLALEKLRAIEAQIQQIQAVEDYANVQTEIISLLQGYVTRISGEREAAAAFIREIGERIIEVESHILEAQDNPYENSDFNTVLEKQMGELRQGVDFSKSLDELKQTVVGSLTTIQKAIENKRVQDGGRMSEMNSRMERLQASLKTMKGEISVANKRAQALEHEVLTDPLTGVYNRRAYEKRISEELQRFRRHGNPFSILLLDVDHFKFINDQYGHAVGDLCLKEIIKRVHPLLRESDFLARFGGEEFVTLLPETKLEGATEVAEKLRKCIEKTEFLHGGKAVGITISIGVTQAESTDMKSESLFTRVDKALYRAKEKGRNRIVVQ